MTKWIRLRDRDGRWLHSRRDSPVPDLRSSSGRGGVWELVEVDEPSEPTLPPIGEVVRGRWSSHFLADHPQAPFFGPAVFAKNESVRLGYYQWLRDHDYFTVMLNGHQDDWGPSRGHPEWTAGGWDWMTEKPLTVRRIEEARRAGLQVWLGVIDQRRAKAWKDNPTRIYQATQDLVDLTAHLVTGYLTTWEATEVWPSADERDPVLLGWISEVDYKGRDVGLHYTPNRRSEVSFYERANHLYHQVVQLYQYRAGASDEELRAETWERPGGSWGMAQVAMRTGVGYCNFEHSSEANQSPTYPPAEVVRRRQVIMEAAAQAQLPPERTGFLN